MESPSFVQQFHNKLPVETQPWVINALRQDQVVWQSLQNTKLAEKALSTCGDQPLAWTPGLLSLLALDVNITHEFFHSTPLKPLESDLRQRAYRTYESLAKGKPGSELPEALLSASPESAPNVNTPNPSPVDTLAEAGLVALALRERLRLIGSWNNFSLELLNRPGVPIKSWYTPLACLFSFIPDPVELISALIYPGVPLEGISLALHAFLSNPMPFADQLTNLQKILSNYQTLRACRPSEISVVLRMVSLQHQELARSLSEWLLDQGNLSVQIETGVAENFRLEQVVESIYLAEIYQIAGQIDHALEILTKGQQAARWLQAGLSAYWATTAELGQSASPAQAHQDLVLSAWKEAVEWTPASFSKEGVSPFQTGLILARLKAGEDVEIQTRLSELVDEEPSCRNQGEPEILLAMAQIAQQLGDLNRASQYACSALTAELEKTSQQQEILSEPLQANLLRCRQENRHVLAKLLYELGLYEKCIEVLHVSLSITPNDPELLFVLGKSLQASYNLKAANQAFQIALMLSPDRLDIHSRLAEGLEAIGDWSCALPERQNILTKIIPEHQDQLKEAYHALAHCALRAGKLDLAVGASEKAISIDPEDGLAYVYLGQASLEIENLQDSLMYFNQSVQFSPHLPEPWLGLAKTYQKLGQTEKIIDTLKEAVQAAPLSYEVHFALGEGYLAQDALTQARQSFRRAYELANTAPVQVGELHWEIALRLGQVLRQLGHLSEAHEILEKAYRQSQLGGCKQFELAYAYAKTLLALDKTDQAIPVLREVLRDEPLDPTPYLDFAKALLASGIDVQDAIQVLQRALEKDPTLLEAQALLAEALSASGDHPNALKAYQASLETELSKDRKWVARLSYGMGCSALALGTIDMAIAALQEAIHADPTTLSFHQKLCEAYWTANLYNNAIQAARSALNLETENPDILVWFAEQAVRFYQFAIPKVQISGQEVISDDAQPDRLYGIKPRQVLTEALNALTQAAQIAQHRGDIYLKLGELQILAGEKKHAIESFRQVITKEVVTQDDLQKTANWLTQLGENNATVACLERAILLLKAQQNTIPCDLMESLSQAYQRTGDTESALEILRQAIAAYPQKGRLHLKVAQIFVNSGRVENALACLEDSLTILEENKDRADIHYHLAQIQRTHGDLLNALANAEQAYLLSESDEVHEKFDWLHLAKHYLVAELARALLQTKLARSYLEGRFHALMNAEQLENSDPDVLNTLVGFYCLKSELAFEDGEEIEAANALTPAVQVAPTHPRSLALQSRFQHRRGDDTLALRTLQEALRQLPLPKELGGNGSVKKLNRLDSHYPNPHISPAGKGFTAADYLGLSEAAMELNLWDLALHLVKKAIESNPQEPYLKLSLASIVVRKAELQHLCQSLDVIKHAPGDNSLSSEQAGLFHKSIQATKQALANIEGASEPTLLNTWDNRGRAAFESVSLPDSGSETQGDSVDAIDWSALPQNVENTASQLAYLMRKAAQERKNTPTHSTLMPSEAGDRQNATQLYPQSALIHLMAGLMFEMIQPTQALHFAQQAANLQNTAFTSLTAMSQALLARLAFQSGNRELAAQAINTALSIWPDEPRWHALAAAITCQVDETSQDAISHLDTATQLEPQNYAHHINLGLLHYQIAKYDPTHIQDALRSFKKGCHLEPNRSDAWMHMAETYLLEGSASGLTQAATLADRAVSLALSDQKEEPPLRLYLLRAEIALRTSDPELAYQCTQKVLKSEPQNAEAAWLKAEALESLNRPAEALSVLEKVIQTDIEPLRFQLKRAALLRQTQGPAAALKLIHSLAEKNPDQPAVLSLLAQILLDAGQKEAALQAAQLALQASPSQPDLSAQEKARLHYMIGMESVEAGQLDNAIHHLNEAIQLDPSFVEPYLELGFAFNKQRQYLKAQNIFHQATVIAPEDPRPFLHTGLALKEGKNYLSAETMLRRAAQLAPADVQIRKHLAAVAALNLVHNPHNIHIAAER